MKRITIKDLAQMLQISTSTVSRALSNHPDISDAVKQRVKEAAEAFNYHPSDFAINFRKNSTKVIGLIIPEMSMFFIPSIIQGISQKLKESSYKFFILSSEECVAQEAENLITCCNSRVDGIIISLTKETNNLDHFKIADDLNVPVVIFDKAIKQNKYDEVLFDSKKNAVKCAQYFIEKDCKKILAVYGNPHLEITEIRRNAFEKALENNNIVVQSLYANSAEAAKNNIESIDNLSEFDGIFAMSDEVLAGINIALQNKEIPVTKINVIAISEGHLPKFLNANYELEINNGLEMGITAAEKLLSRIRNKSDKEKTVIYV